jgi:hypothetical protein
VILEVVDVTELVGLKIEYAHWIYPLSLTIDRYRERERERD